MKMKHTYLTPLAILAVACNSLGADPELQYGEITVSLGEPNVEVITKAETPAVNTVVIYNDENAQMATGTGTKTLPFDTYYVTAESCSAAEAENGDGTMRLYGRSADVTLDASHLSQTATVNCTVANAKVTVKFDPSVSGRFNDGNGNSTLKVVLKGGTTANRTLTVNEKDLTAGSDGSKVKETWFNPSSLTYEITGTFNAGGVNKSVNLNNNSAPRALSAKDNIQILVKVSLSNGQLVPEITVDTTLNSQETINGEFNPYV